MFFATDVIQERSYGSNHKENMVITMTNSAIVGALLLTMVVAAMQADNPSEIGSFLSQGYQVILVISCYYSVNATATSNFFCFFRPFWVIFVVYNIVSAKLG